MNKSSLVARLGSLERVTAPTAPLLLYAPDGALTPELQALKVEADATGRPVLLVNEHDAAL